MNSSKNLRKYLKYLPDDELLDYIKKVGRIEDYVIIDIESARDLANKILFKTREYTPELWNLYQAAYIEYPAIREDDPDPLINRGRIIKYKIQMNNDIVNENAEYIDNLFYKLKYRDIDLVSEFTGMDYFNSYVFWTNYVKRNYQEDQIIRMIGIIKGTSPETNIMKLLRGFNLGELRRLVERLEMNEPYISPEKKIIDVILNTSISEEEAIDLIIDIIKSSDRNIVYEYGYDFEPSLICAKANKYKLLYWLISNNIYVDENVPEIMINIRTDYDFEICISKIKFINVNIKDLINYIFENNYYKKFYLIFRYHEFLKLKKSYERLLRNNYGYITQVLDKKIKAESDKQISDRWSRMLIFFTKPF